MAIITPQTDLVLLQCPLEPDQQNQLTFASATAQYNYFNGLQKIPVDDFTYQRKDGTIRFPAHIDDVRTYNYCMYRNDAYSNKWFYAFITNMEYANDGVTMIKIETDVWQTWQFDFVFKRSFVQREHTNNDAFGANTLDEGLNVGNYIVNGFSEFAYQSNPQDMYIAALVTELLPGTWPEEPNVPMIGGVPQGCYPLVLDPWGTNIKDFVKAYDIFGKADAIISMYVLPKKFYDAPLNFISYEGNHEGVYFSFDYRPMPRTTEAKTLGTFTWTRNTTLDGYTPKNNKLYGYPYNYLLITNNNGEDREYYWEDFSTSNANFTMGGVPSLGCNIRIYPSNYKVTNQSGGYEWSIEAGQLPQVSWNSDYYLNWEASQGVRAGYNAASSYVSDYGKAGEAVASGKDQINPMNIIEGIGRTLSSFGAVFKGLFNEVSSGYSESLKPNQNRGQSTGDLNYAVSKTCFTGYRMSIKVQQARMIDDYFSMYGYRTDALKIPNITGRSNWNFVKTQVCNIIGNIPQGDIEQMKSIMNNGITFWHNPATYLDYSQNNTIV